jgi:hypothetical protein
MFKYYSGELRLQRVDLLYVSSEIQIRDWSKNVLAFDRAVTEN